MMLVILVILVLVLSLCVCVCSFFDLPLFYVSLSCFFVSGVVCSGSLVVVAPATVSSTLAAGATLTTTFTVTTSCFVSFTIAIPLSFYCFVVLYIGHFFLPFCSGSVGSKTISGMLNHSHGTPAFCLSCSPLVQLHSRCESGLGFSQTSGFTWSNSILSPRAFNIQ